MTQGALQVVPDWIETHAPNTLQLIPLDIIDPSEDNIRLFIERESLAQLRAAYRAFKLDPEGTLLPDPPVVRFKGKDQPLELLAGHRRIHGATDEGLEYLPCRVVTADDPEAYLFIISANQYETITTVELAYKAAEMERLGFSNEDILKMLNKRVGITRYLTVGRFIEPDEFSDVEKKCDPSIQLWFEAAVIGEDHFRYCFANWNAGLWDEEECRIRFRRRRKGRSLPIDHDKKGARTTRDNRIYRVRATFDLDMLTRDEFDANFTATLRDMMAAYTEAITFGRFGNGQREIKLFIPKEDDDG
jgi:hypothetical protein